MRGHDLLNKIRNNLTSTLLFNNSISHEIIRHLQNSIEDVEILDFFYQIRKSERSQGLSFEMLIITENLIYDIEFDEENANFNYSLIKSIVTVKLDIGQFSTPSPNTLDNMAITLSFIFENGNSINYRADYSKLLELTRIHSNFLKIII